MLRERAIAPFLFQFFRMFILVLGVMVPLFQSLGLSMGDVFQLQAIFGISIVALEIPTGYLADRWGRNRTLSTGAFLYGACFTWLYFCRSFSDLVIYELCIAVGYSLISGADISLIYDAAIKQDLDIEQRRERGKRVIGNMQLCQTAGEAAAAIVGGWLAVQSFRGLLGWQIVVGWIPFILALFIGEVPREPLSRGETHVRMMARAFRVCLGEQVLVRLLLMNLVVWGLASFFVVWILQKYWETRGINLVSFGWLWAASNLVVGVFGKQVPLILKLAGRRGALSAIAVLPLVGYFGMAMGQGVWGVILGFLFSISRGVNYVYLKESFNRHIPSELRATANSIQTFFFRLVFAVMGPGVGHLIDTKGVNLTLNVLGTVFIVAFIAVMGPLFRRYKEI